MAKVEKEYTVPEKLGNLYKLQTYESEIARIQSIRGELPREVSDLENTISALTKDMEELQNKILESQKYVKEKQADIQASEELIAKYTAQQDDVKNNKEYEFLAKEIEFQTLEIELLNKRIREAEASIEELRGKVAADQQEIEYRQNDLDIKKGELDEIIAETRSEEETLREKAKKIVSTIDEKLFKTFERILKNAHNHLAIVAIERDSCGGCHNRIAPQRQVDVRTRKKIIYCEYCGRILIDAELAEENEVRRRRKSILAHL